MHRFIVDFAFAEGQIKIKDRILTHQLKRVLRILPGQQIVLCDGAGLELTATLSEYTEYGCLLMSYGNLRKAKRDERIVRLYMAILKNNNFEWAIEKAVEAGVHEIIPMVTARTEKKSVNKGRLYRIITEACEQSGRAYLPKLHPIAKAEKVLTNTNEHNVLFHPEGSPVDSINFKEVDILNIYVGPEGGFAPEEVEVARAHGFEIASLGHNTLRAETAAAVVSYLACRE